MRFCTRITKLFSCALWMSAVFRCIQQIRFQDMATLPQMPLILHFFHYIFLFQCISTEICKHHFAKHLAAVSWAVRLGGMCQFCGWLSLVGASGSSVWTCENQTWLMIVVFASWTQKHVFISFLFFLAQAAVISHLGSADSERNVFWFLHRAV